LDDIVKLTIDGQPVEAKKGMTVLQAAEEFGFLIPTLCADADLKPHAACRLCVVEIEGVRGLPTACTTPVTEGMKVKTDSPAISAARRVAVELIRSDHPSDCNACPKNNQCELQMMEALIGVQTMPFDSLGKDMTVDKSNPFFNLDRNYCILCGKCVRTCDEVCGVEVYTFADRGYGRHVATFGDGLLIDSNCESCGACVDHCPVYALIPKETRKPTKEIESTCPHCGVGCGISLGARSGEVVQSHGRKGNTVNNGNLCVKGRFGIPEFVHGFDRLKSPMVKRDGELVSVEWDEALDVVAKKFAEYKGNEIAVIASAKCTNEDTYLAQKFARVALGTNNIDNQARLYASPSVTALTRAFGSGAMTNSIEEIMGAACILAIGTDTTVTHPIIGQKMKQAVRNGTKLIVVNSRENNLVHIASVWLRPKSGTDVALLIGMERVIVDEGLLDSNFIKERCKEFETFKESLKAFPLNVVAETTGVPAEKITEAAMIYAKNSPAAIFYGPDFIRSSHGTDNIDAVANLAILTGNVGKPSSGVNPLVAQNNGQGACDMGAVPDFYPGYQSLSDSSVKSKFETAWGCSLNSAKGLSLDEIYDAANKKQIKAAYIIGFNPLLGEPDSDNVKKALDALDFLVVQDVFMTNTAKMADVVLPATTFAEKDGTFTNTERRVQRVRKAADTIGDSRPDWLITCQLAQKMGKKGFEFDDPARIMEEIAGLTPIYGGISYERLETGGLQWPCPDKESAGTPVLHVGAFAGGKGQFKALEYKPAEKLTDGTYPLMLTLGRSLYFTRTGTLTRKVSGLSKLKGVDNVEINPEDALALQIKDGDKVKITSRAGELVVKAKVTDAQPKGAVFMVSPFKTQTTLLNAAVYDAEFKLPKYAVCAVRVEKAT
jgi:formate dehydrogenase (NADP+) alpha subunit